MTGPPEQPDIIPLHPNRGAEPLPAAEGQVQALIDLMAESSSRTQARVRELEQQNRELTEVLRSRVEPARPAAPELGAAVDLRRAVDDLRAAVDRISRAAFTDPLASTTVIETLAGLIRELSPSARPAAGPEGTLPAAAAAMAPPEPPLADAAAPAPPLAADAPEPGAADAERPRTLVQAVYAAQVQNAHQTIRATLEAMKADILRAARDFEYGSRFLRKFDLDAESQKLERRVQASVDRLDQARERVVAELQALNGELSEYGLDTPAGASGSAARLSEQVRRLYSGVLQRGPEIIGSAVDSLKVDVLRATHEFKYGTQMPWKVDWDVETRRLVARIDEALGHLDRARDSIISDMRALDAQLTAYREQPSPVPEPAPAPAPPQPAPPYGPPPPAYGYPYPYMPPAPPPYWYGMPAMPWYPPPQGYPPPGPQPTVDTAAPGISEAWDRLLRGVRPDASAPAQPAAAPAPPPWQPPAPQPPAAAVDPTPAQPTTAAPSASPAPQQPAASEPASVTGDPEAAAPDAQSEVPEASAGPTTESGSEPGPATPEAPDGATAVDASAETVPTDAAPIETTPFDETVDLIGEQTQLIVYGFESFSAVSWFLRAVHAVDEVRSVRVRRFHRGSLQLVVEHEGVGSLTDKLGRISGAGFELNLLNVGPGRVEAQLVPEVGDSPADEVGGAA